MIEPQTVDGITPEYLTGILRSYYATDLRGEVTDIDITPVRKGLFTNLGGGIFRISMEYSQSGDEFPSSIILKASPSDTTAHRVLCERVRDSKSQVPLRLIPNLGVNHREVMSYRHLPGKVEINMPKVYHYVVDEAGDRIWIFMEDLESWLCPDQSHRAKWDIASLGQAVKDLARFHAASCNNLDMWRGYDWLFQPPPGWMEHARIALRENRRLHPNVITSNGYQLLEPMIQQLPTIAHKLETMTSTLIHGDCTSRNACLVHKEGGPRLTLFDWGFTGISHPGEDVTALLFSILSPASQWHLLHTLFQEYYSEVEQAFTCTFDEFYEGIVVSTLWRLIDDLMAATWNSSNTAPWLFVMMERELVFLEHNHGQLKLLI